MENEYLFPEFEGKRILLTEDNKLNAAITVEILKNAGLEIDVAEDDHICKPISKNQLLETVRQYLK